MSNHLLRRCGKALYGPRWQSDLARDLKVSDRTVRRWVAGTDDVPEPVYRELSDLCNKRVAELGGLLSSLSGSCGVWAHEPPPDTDRKKGGP
jgi:hypothetical protein